MEFTEEQLRVIESRDKNVLVAAAAGSGKTAVLVSRIIGRVLDGENPVDIDRILVVTFTNAAAAEMKERIRNALEDELEKNPDNDYLLRQMNLIHSAHIMTIDSFCRMVLLDNFDRIGIEPNLRIADENELEIMKEDAIAEILEEFYEEASEEFMHFLDEFSTRRDDSDLQEAVVDLFEFSQSKVEPEQWLKNLEEAYIIENDEELEKKSWMTLLLKTVKEELNDCLSELERAVEIASEPAGPGIYIDNLTADMEQIGRVKSEENYEKMRDALSNLNFGRLSSKKDPDIDSDLRELVKNIRDNVKKRVSSLKENFFRNSIFEIAELLRKSHPLVKELSIITKKFAERFGEMKEEKNIIDFSDLEHIALNALKTGAGADYREYFAEVMTDEYQDSNSVQEEILTSVARDNNYFCVGDVKQSIYSFRLADPSIFMHRYIFSEKDEKSERILLSKNFRSRTGVINSVNAVFGEIMHESIGGVEYDEDAALHPGAAYTENDSDHVTEFILAVNDGAEEVDDIEIEAKITADRIKEMVGNFQVQSLKDGSLRPADYSDFAILLRSLKGADEIYAKALEEAGIPAFMDSRTGYFQTEEIRTVISFLTIINNPVNDIALAAVMLNVIGGFNDEEMAEIRQAMPEGTFYKAVMVAAGKIEAEEIKSTEKYTVKKISDALADKCRDFLEKLDGYRKLSSYTPIHRLIERIIDESGYEFYALAKGGSAEKNLKLLVKKAEDFEKTSYKGIFFFLRYIEKLKKYDMDFGEAKGVNEGMNAVRIMSIHKSKGLEFPVVFIGRLSKKFNTSDLKGKTVMDSDIGIGIERTDAESRIRYTVPIKNIIAEKRRREAVGEELRIFYVAMTRAKEKLIMTAVSADPDKLLSSPAKSVSRASSYLDFILKAIEGEKTDSVIRTRVKNLSEMVYDSLEENMMDRIKREYYEHLDLSAAIDEKTAVILNENLSWEYPYEYTFSLPSKLSVSRIKKEMMSEEESQMIISDERKDEAEEGENFETAIKEKAEFMQKASIRGTAYHKAFELVEIDRIKDLDSAQNYLDELVEEEQLTKEAAEMVRADDLLAFSRSELAKRMDKAQRGGKLFREQPFIILRPASIVDKEWPEDENIQIQGIIDAFFIENEKIYLVDYKTDRGVNEETLVNRYRVQLEMYAEGLSGILGLEIGEKIIYSVYLKKAVYVGNRSMT